MRDERDLSYIYIFILVSMRVERGVQGDLGLTGV